ncbi:MAG: DNA repair protein RecO [Clostridia bacterium]|nr:DNA repair protein RecO [Clostridia bacterium]
MDRITVHGLNVKETETGDYDKIITLVTQELGKITVTGKGVKSLKSRHMVACQPFAYSTFVLKKSKKFWYIEESENIECFFGIRTEMDRLALSAYVCDVLCDVTVENAPEPDLLRLTLNTLYAISYRKDIDLDMIKAAFEMRCACECGFCPELSGCDVCGCDVQGDVYLDVMNGRLLCPSCKPRAEKEEALIEGTARLYYIISPCVLAAMRYVIACDLPKLLAFTIEKDELYLFGKVAEGYLTNHLEHKFATLDFYKSILL